MTRPPRDHGRRSTRTLSGRRRPVIALVAVAAVVAVVAAARGGDGADDTAVAARPTDTAGVSASIVREYKAFQRPRRATDLPPVRWENMISDYIDAVRRLPGKAPRAGGRPAVRRISSTAKGDLYLVADRNIACLHAMPPGGGVAPSAGSCSRAVQVATLGMLVGQAAAPPVEGRRIRGVAPAAVATIRVLRRNRSPVLITPRGNAFDAQWEGSGAAIEFRRADGSLIDRMRGTF